MATTILTCAVTGGAPISGNNPAVPVTPAQIAQQSIDAAKAGAAVVHIHVAIPRPDAPAWSLSYIAKSSRAFATAAATW